MARRRLKKSIFHFTCTCGTEFIANHNQAKYCSEKCRIQANRLSNNKCSLRLKDVRSEYQKNYYQANKEKINARVAAYKKTEAGKRAQKVSDRRQRAKHKEKYVARYKVKDALLKGILIRQPCMFCECKKTEAHHDDYSKPLDVKWMCLKCHRAYHKRIIEDGSIKEVKAA